MLGLDRQTLRAGWTLAVLAALLWGAFIMRRTLLLFVAAILFAYLLSPLVTLAVSHSRRKLTRNAALAIVYTLLVAVLLTGGSLIVTRVVEQATALAARVPDLVSRLEQGGRLPLPEILRPMEAHILTGLQSWLAEHSGDLVSLARTFGTPLLRVLTNVPLIVLVPILSFFFVKDGAAIREFLVAQWAGRQPRETVREVLDVVHHLVSQYVRAIFLLSLTTFLTFLLFFLAMDVPYAFLLATTAGLLEFIPVLGPATAALIIVVVAWFGGAGVAMLLAFLAVYRLVLDYLILPHLFGSTLKVPPLLIIFGTLAGEQLGGVWGMFLAIPVIAIGRALFLRLRAEPDPEPR